MKFVNRTFVLVAAIFLLSGRATRAQYAPNDIPIFPERLAGLFDPESRTYYSLQTMQGQQFGNQQPYTGIGASHYLGSIDDTVTLFNGQTLINNNGNPAGTFGAQQRWLTNLPALNTSILGGGLYLDFSQSRYGNLFQQVNLNLELYTESAWVGRVNGYFPIGQQQTSTGPQFIQGSPNGQLSIIGNTVGFGGISLQQMDVALMGSDFEVARKFRDYRMEAYAAYYNWNGPTAGFTNGVKGGVRGFLTDSLSGNISISHDDFFGTNVYGGVTYTFGGSGGRRPVSFVNLMTQPVQRAQQVAIGSFVHSVDTFHPAHDAVTGAVVHTYFVTQGGTGNGTESNPSNVQSVLANPSFGKGSAIVLLNDNGNITSPIGLTQDGQQIVGGGSTGTANIDFSQALGHAPGTDVLHLTGLGGTPVLAPNSGNAVTLTNQNVVQGFTIDGSGGITNGISGNPGATDTLITNMTLQNITGTGVLINPSTNTVIGNSIFKNNGTDIKLDAANSQITNIISTGSRNGAISLGVGGDITGNTLISNVNISGAGGFGGILLNNAQNGSTTNLTDVKVTGGTGAGLTVTNSQSRSLYNLTNVDILNVGGHGMSLQNSTGTFNVNATSSISNAGASAFAINGGSIDVKDKGSISQANNSSALDIANHAGTVTFDTVSSIQTTNGNGLQFVADNGIYDINGTISLSGGNAMISIADGNGQFAFHNPLIQNTGSGPAVSIVGGKSSTPVTTFNGLNVTSLGGPGFIVTNGGLTNVTGTATINTAGAAALDVTGTPLAMTFTSLTSTDSAGNGVNIAGSSGILNVATVTVKEAIGNGIDVSNTAATLTIGKLNVDGATIGAYLHGNSAGAFTVSGTEGAGTGGTIKNVSDHGVLAVDTSNTSLSNMIIDAGNGTRGVSVVATTGTDTFSLTNSTVTGGIAQAVGIGADGTGVLNATINGNTLTGTGSTSSASGFGAVTSATGLSGGNLNLAFSGNTLSSASSAGAYISNFNPLTLTTGGTVTITEFANNAVLTSNAGHASTPLTGGILVNGVTFDAELSAAGIQTVNGGTLTIGSLAAPENVSGDGLRLNDVSGALTFSTVNIGNTNGTGLSVNTTVNSTDFQLTNTDGAIATTNGAAMTLDPLTAYVTFDSVSSTNSTTDGVSLDGVSGYVNLGNTSITNAAGSGLSMLNSSAGVTTGNLDINEATSGLTFGQNDNGTFIATGTTSIVAANGTGISLNGAKGSYTFADLTVGITGASTGLDFANSNVMFTSQNTTILGDGTAGSIGIDLSGSMNPNGANSATPNIQLANAAGKTATTSNVDTGVLLGSAANGSAGANFIYGNQTPMSSGGSGSSISVISGGLTLDTTHLTSANSLTQGQYNFMGISFSGLASFQTSANTIFVGSSSSGTDSGLTPTDRISIAQLVSLDADPANLDGKTIVLVNDNGGAGLNLGATSLTLGTNTTLQSFGNGNTVSVGSSPANVIVDSIKGLTFSDPNGAATLTNSDASKDVIVLGNSDTIQYLNVEGGRANISANGVNFINVNHTTLSGAAEGIALSSTGGSITLDSNTVLNASSDGMSFLNALSAVSVSGGSVNESPIGLLSQGTNLTADGVDFGTSQHLGNIAVAIVPTSVSNTITLSNLSTSGTGAWGTGISIVDSSNAIGRLTVNLSDNSMASTLNVNMIGNSHSDAVVLNMTSSNEWSCFGGGHAMQILGSSQGNGMNSVVVTSLGSGTIDGTGGLGGGLWFSNVTFDASGVTHQGTEVTAGDWTIGTAASRVTADGLRFDAPSGKLSFGTLNIANDGGTGLYVDTKSTGTPFTLENAAGSIDTTNGSALFLDPLATDLTFDTVSSMNSTTTGATLDSVTGKINVNHLNVSGSAASALLINNSINLTSTFNTVAISSTGTTSTDNGVTLVNAGKVSILGGKIDGTKGDGIYSSNTKLTAAGLTIGGTTPPAGNGITIISNDGTTYTATLSNNTITATGKAISTTDSGIAKELVLTLDGNTLQSTGAFYALDVVGGKLNSTIIKSMNGGTILGGANSGGAELRRVTFDASGTALTGVQVAGGNWTIGTTSNRVQHYGLAIASPSGNLGFGTLNIATNQNAALYIDTTPNGTAFTVSSSDGTIDTTNNTAMILDTVTTDLRFSSVTSSNAVVDGLTLNAINGKLNLGDISVTNAQAEGLSLSHSSVAVTANTVTINGALNGMFFQKDTGGGFTATGATQLSNLFGSGIVFQSTTGTYQLADLGVNSFGDVGLDFSGADVSFTSGNTTLTGDTGKAGVIGIDLSGSKNPNGTNSTVPNIKLADTAGQTATISSVSTGILLGDGSLGSAGANFVFGNQTPITSGGSGSSISVLQGGTTLDTTHLTSTNSLTQGRYNFVGVGFAGLASFQKSSDVLFVGSTSAGGDDGSNPSDRISLSQLLALDATPSNLNGKSIVLVNDNGGAGLNLGANSLTLGTNTVLEGFGNGQSISVGSPVPVNVIVDSVTSPVVYSDPNGAATLTNDGSTNVVILQNNDTIQNLIISGGSDTITGSSIAGVNINHDVIGDGSGAGISLSNTTGTIVLSQNAIRNTGADGILLSSDGTVTINGGTIDGTSADGINSTNTGLTATGIVIGSSSTISGNGITIVNTGTQQTVELSNNTITATKDAITTKDTGVLAELLLSLDGNTLQSTGASGQAMNITGLGLNSTVITSMNGGTVIGGTTSHGVEFNRVTFDASGAALGGTNVTGGNWSFGTTGNRVTGDGLRFDAPTGKLGFGTLNIANDSGTGLSVDTKTVVPNTSFALGSTGGSIDTTNGSAAYLDPLAANLTFSSISSVNSSSNGISLDTVSGSVTINGGTITDAAGADVSIANSSATTLLSGLTLNTNGNTGVTLVHNGGAITFTDLTMNRTSGDTAFNIDATDASSGNITIDGTSTLGNTAGAAFLIGAGSRNIDATALAISNDNTSTGPVISITGQTGGTIGFGSITNDGTSATNVIATTNQSGGTLNFGNVTITHFNNTSGNAVSLDGTSASANVNLTNLDVTTTSGGALTIGDLTFSTGSTSSLNATGATALTMNGTSTTVTFTSVGATNTGDGNAGVNLSNVTGTVTLKGVNIIGAGTIGNAAAGILANSVEQLVLTSPTIDGTTANGVDVTNSGLIINGGSIGTITAVAGDGVFVNNTDNIDRSVTIASLKIGDSGTSVAAGDQGISLNSTGTGTLTATLNGDVVYSTNEAFATTDAGMARELVLALGTTTGDFTFERTTAGYTIDVAGSGVNSTIVTSLGNVASTATVTGNGVAGGALFDQVTFDASGTALSATQVTASDWNIGKDTTDRVSGYGLRFNTPAGDVAFGTLNIYNDGHTGLYANAASSTGSFTIGSTGGAIDTTHGRAINLDTVATALTFTSVTSADSFLDGMTLSNISGTIDIGTVNVTNPTLDGIYMEDSTAALTISQLNVDGADIGAELIDNVGGSFTVTGNGTAGSGGTLQNLGTGGVRAIDTSGVSLNDMVIDCSASFGGIEALSTITTSTFNLTNSTVIGGYSSAVTIGADDSGVMNATITGNTLSNPTIGALGTAFFFTSGDGDGGGTLKLSFSNNTVSATDGLGLFISDIDPVFFTQGGPVTISDFSNNTVTQSSFAGIYIIDAIFDSDPLTAGNQTVDGGTLTIGSSAATTDVSGFGMVLSGVSGDLSFTTLNIANDGGIGLVVDTKSVPTTFSLENTGGSIDTTNGSAIFLDPLTANLTFTSITSTNSTSDGITLDTVAGIVDLGDINVSGATGSGLSMVNSSAIVTAGTVTVDGATSGLTFGNNILDSVTGRFTASGTTTLTNITGTGIDLTNATGTYQFADLTIGTTGTTTGLSFMNSSVMFAARNVSITGDGTAGSIGIDLSGSLNPNGPNSSTPNIRLANTAVTTAQISAVDTGVLLGDAINGSAGANFVYGTQVPGNSGSSISVDTGGLTLDTTYLVSTNSHTQGQYLFNGVHFTGIASFQISPDLLFVGSTSAGADNGVTPDNRISLAELIALDTTPSNLDGKHIVLVNDNAPAGLNLGANTLTLGTNTILDSFGNGHTISVGGAIPVNVFVDTISLTYKDPLGAATLTNDGSTDIVTLGNGDTIQNLKITAGTAVSGYSLITGNGVDGVNINNNFLNGLNQNGDVITLVNTTGTITLASNTIADAGNATLGVGGAGIDLINAGKVAITGGEIDGASYDGINVTNTDVTIDGVAFGANGHAIGASGIVIAATDAGNYTVTLKNVTSADYSLISGTGIDIESSGTGSLSVNLSGNSIAATQQALLVNEAATTPVADTVLLNMTGVNSWRSGTANYYSIDILGQNVSSTSNSVVIESLGSGNVTGSGGVIGGVRFSNVTFDASGAAQSGTQVVAGDWTIGMLAHRVTGDGMHFDAPIGDLKLGALNIDNIFGTGLFIETKSAGTTFTLANTGGSIDTKFGTAMFLDPLTTDLTFGTVKSTGSTGNGIGLVGVTGSLTINGGTVEDGTQGLSAVSVYNAALTGTDGLTLNLNHMTINGPTAAPGILLSGQSTSVPIVLNLNSTQVTGGAGFEQELVSGDISYGGGAGIQAYNATITLDLNSTSTGGAGVGGSGAGAGIGGSGGSGLGTNFFDINFGTGLSITNNGIVTGGSGGSDGGSGAGVGGGGGGIRGTAGNGNGASNLGTGQSIGGNGFSGGGGGAGIGGGGGGSYGFAGNGNGTANAGTATGGIGGSFTGAGAGVGGGGGGNAGGVVSGNGGTGNNASNSGTATGGNATHFGGGGAGVGGGGGAATGSGGSGTGASNSGTATGGSGSDGGTNGAAVGNGGNGP